jgi:hypothetical protein
VTTHHVTSRPAREDAATSEGTITDQAFDDAIERKRGQPIHEVGAHIHQLIKGYLPATEETRWFDDPRRSRRADARLS